MSTTLLENIQYKLRRLSESNNQIVKGLKSFGEPQKLLQRLGCVETALASQKKLTFREQCIRDAAWNVPRFYSIRFDFETAASAEQTKTVTIDQEGWFFCDRIFATWLITATSLPATGRFMPVSSGNPAIAATTAAAAVIPVDIIDFYWEYSEGRSQRNRQNLPLPSDILFRQDLDGFPPEGDAFGPNSTVSFSISPTRAIEHGGTLQIILAGVQCLEVLEQ